MSLSIAKSAVCNSFSSNARGCGPTDRYQAAYQSMDPSKAAQTVLKHFDAIEGVGMNASGAGAGDNNIGTSELRRVAEPNSGFPPEVRAAAKWMLDHPIALRSLDQGASKAHGGNNEVHLSKADLQAHAKNASDCNAPQRPTFPQRPSPCGPGFGGGSGFGGGFGGFGGMQGLPNPHRPNLPPRLDLCGPSFGQGPQSPFGAGRQGPMDVYKAAQTLKDHFNFAEGVGMNGSGKGAGDNNIGLSELKRVADPKSGAPKELREAAQFLLNHPTALKSVDQGASKSKSGKEVHISLQDLEAFTAKAPQRETQSNRLDLAQFMGRASIWG
ncbi:hypothetical protein A176_001244 [Myxococcus hansupus]|uniref:Uncharacterized protein n=1 Tax=Pseudomyxococcus hansupus TaxID=1297742 RepID=A0A0H4X8Z1_9BACT|nr:hypothetical protein [Myxococcus hansupus]AKQ64332.1 hypothetical protein A176_001244 [Myxococcus hansupus]